MNIEIITPARVSSLTGNRVTAGRWKALLRQLGHRVRVNSAPNGRPVDLMIALHARRSARPIERFRRDFPERALVVTLTGTDLYHDIQRSRSAQRSLELADRLVLLQSDGISHLPQRHQGKARVIFQSSPMLRRQPTRLKNVFEVVVVGHLRPVKDPFRCAMAVRRLSSSSQIRVVHLGAALSESMRQRAERETATNVRYQWLGELPRWQTSRRLARARLLVLSSRMEGGANVISEAIVAGVPVLSSRISGSLGLLGHDYPGYFEVGDTGGLRKLLLQAEQDVDFYGELQARCDDLKSLFDPARELQSWRELLAEL